jgi:ABC-type lipoprotein release transport system permease subunit
MVFKVTLLEMGLVGLMAGGVGAVLAWVIAQIFNLDLPAGKVTLIVPLGVALCLLGGIIPAMRTSRVPLAVTLREGEVHIGKRRSVGKRSLLGYVLRSLMRRRIRAILVMATMALSAGLLTVFMAATLGLQGYLSGTLLGEYLLLRIEGYHYLMTGVCLLVAGITVADALLVSTFERNREIGLLKAVGWRSGQVLQLFLEEGTLLGLVGGCAGVALGVSLIWVLYGDLPKGVGLVALVGLMVTLVIGLLAAIIPGVLAARTPPAEAMQYE